jgi:hypothetical protein
MIHVDGQGHNKQRPVDYLFGYVLGQHGVLVYCLVLHDC